MRIVIVTPSFAPVVGGAEVGIERVASYLAQSHQVKVLVGVYDDMYRPEPDQCGEYAVHYFRPPWSNRRPRFLRRVLAATAVDYMFELAKINRRFRPEVVNTHFLRPHGLVNLFAKYVLRLPTVQTLAIQSDVIEKLGPWSRIHAAISLHASSAITQNSDYYTSGSRYATEAITIPYGVDAYRAKATGDLRAKLGIPDNKNIIVSVQRLVPSKRVECLIEMMESLCASLPDTTLVLIGDGPERKRLEDAAAVRSCGNSVKFLGEMPYEDVQHVYSESSCYVSHTEHETFGMVFVEAMAAGLPIVAPDNESMRRILPPQCRLMFPPNDITAFADQVAAILNDSVMRSAMSCSAVAGSTQVMTWSETAERFESIFISVVGKR